MGHSVCFTTKLCSPYPTRWRTNADAVEATYHDLTSSLQCRKIGCSRGYGAWSKKRNRANEPSFRHKGISIWMQSGPPVEMPHAKATKRTQFSPCTIPGLDAIRGDAILLEKPLNWRSSGWIHRRMSTIMPSRRHARAVLLD